MNAKTNKAHALLACGHVFNKWVKTCNWLDYSKIFYTVFLIYNYCLNHLILSSKSYTTIIDLVIFSILLLVPVTMFMYARQSKML